MSTLPQIEPAEATGEAAALLAEVQKSLGAVPNMAKVMANSPGLLRGWLELSGALARGVLPAGVRERLALAAAEYNRCEYCLSAHTYIGANVAKIDSSELERAPSPIPPTRTPQPCSHRRTRSSENAAPSQMQCSRRLGPPQ